MPHSTVHPARCSLAAWFRRIADRLAPQSDVVERIRPFVDR